MELLDNYNKQLQSMKKNISQWAKEAIIDNKDTIVNIVKLRQLNKGFNSFGSPLEFTELGNAGDGYYAPTTQGYADADNITTPKTFGSPYNFYWSGETFENMRLGGVNKSKKSYNIVTVRGKQKLLESIYGEIFDLTEENNKFVNVTIIEPYIAKKIQETIGGFL